MSDDQPTPDDLERGGRRRVLTLCLGLIGLIPVLLVSEPRIEGPVRWEIAGLVGVLYILGEFMAAEIEFRRETHTFGFTSVPLVIGLLLLPAVVVVAVRLVTSIVVLGVVRRQEPFKLVLNLATHALEVAAAGSIVAFVGVPASLGSRAWLAAGLAVIVADLAGAVAITAAISLFQAEWNPSLLAGVWMPMAVAVVDVSLAMIVSIGLQQRSVLVWLAVPIGAFLVAITRSYGRIRARYRAMERLDRYARELGGAVVDGEVERSLLPRIADVLHADVAWVWSPELGPESRLVYRASGWLDREPASSFDLATLPLLSDGARLIRPGDLAGGVMEAWGLTEAISARLDVGHGRHVVIGVADRSGVIRRFDREDVVLFDTLCSHAAVSLRNVALVDELRAESAENEHLATHDPLTGLPNRALFHRRLEHALGLTNHVAALLIDLDRFKEVNDTLGHACGDEMLVEVGRRLESLLADDEVLARLGGDEFALLLRAPSYDSVLARADRLLAELRRPFSVAGLDVDVDASIGVAFPPREPVDASGLLRQADVAMYSAKDDHGGIAVYSPDRDHYSPKRLALVGKLRRAIDDEELVLYYQPQVDLATGRVTAVEALVRWQQPGEGLVPPAEFIEVAEQTDLIHTLTRFVLRSAISQAAAWHRAGRSMRVSVNLSARNLSEEDLVETISGLLQAEALPASLLEVELTETTVMINATRARRAMTELRGLGVRVAIDDFGTGHSSLSYLTSLDVDLLKIDQSFIRAMATDASAETVVRAIVDLAHSLRLDVVAEGVETVPALRALGRMGCPTAQGYFYSRPIPAPEFEVWLTTWDETLSSGAVIDPATAAPFMGGGRVGGRA